MNLEIWKSHHSKIELSEAKTLLKERSPVYCCYNNEEFEVIKISGVFALLRKYGKFWINLKDINLEFYN